MTPAERSNLVRERCARSFLWKIIHWLGSLGLALILLATISIACAVATFAESGFSAKVAQAYIYKSPWFILWLGVLCINLFAVTLTRWPWEKRHAGFIVTHYGIILLLAGAMIGLHSGFEGNVTLNIGRAPAARVTTNRSVIQIESPAEGAVYLLPFDADLARPSPLRPKEFVIPGSRAKIVADSYAPHVTPHPKLVPDGTGAPSLILRLASPRLGRSTAIPLSITDNTATAKNDFFGLAEIRFSRDLPPPPAAEPAESRMVFANFAPVMDPSLPAHSPLDVRLGTDGKTLTILRQGGQSATYLVSEALGKPIPEAGFTVTLEKFWPHFSIQNGTPANLSDNPENPAALVRIAGSAHPLPSLDLALAADNSVSFRFSGGPAGALIPGQKIATGWADWELEILDFSSSAAPVNETSPADPQPGETAMPGFRAHLESPSGERGPDRWIGPGDVASLAANGTSARLGYGLETRALPFTIRLKNFEVPRDEGTDSPADFISTVEFLDPSTGETKTAQARMNRPASFPGTFAANLTGINFKFSQAEWNPRDLGETTLQVLYDPGWLLKWIGSLAICVGIAMQFYWKPRPIRRVARGDFPP